MSWSQASKLSAILMSRSSVLSKITRMVGALLLPEQLALFSDVASPRDANSRRDGAACPPGERENHPTQVQC